MIQEFIRLTSKIVIFNIKPMEKDYIFVELDVWANQAEIHHLEEEIDRQSINVNSKMDELSNEQRKFQQLVDELVEFKNSLEEVNNGSPR